MKHVIFPLIVLSATTQAADLPTPPNAINDEWRNNRQEIRAIEDAQREESAWKLQQKQNSSTTQPDEKNTQSENSECLPNQKIQLQGITLIDAHTFRLPECVSEANLNQLSREITAAYIKAGFAGTQIDFIQQDDTVIFKVKEMRIREITGGSRTVNIGTLFPNHKNQPVNIRYLDQGIEQANKLTGNQVSMDVYPHDDGTASIALQNQKSKGWFGQVAIDNKGNKNNRGVIRANAGVASPLGLSDSVYLGAYSNTAQGNGHFNRGANIYYSLPYGAWTFSAYGSTSRSRSITKFNVTGTEIALDYNSKTTAAGVKTERVISRGQKHITYAHLGVDYLNILSEFGGSKIDMQSPKLGVVQTGLSHSQTLDSGIWISGFTVERGTGLFGAKDLDTSPFSSHFTNFLANTSLAQYRRKGNWIIRNQHTLAAQHSDDDLYSTKQISITDRNSVRGFNQYSLNGNTGIYAQNTLFAKKYLPNQFSIEPYIGIDGGWVKDKGWQRAFGGAVGLNVAYGNHWQMGVESAYGFAFSENSDKIRQRQITASLRMMF